MNTIRFPNQYEKDLVAGSWIFHDFFDDGIFHHAEVSQEGESLTGTLGQNLLRGRHTGNNVELTVLDDRGELKRLYRGILHETQLRGEVSAQGSRALFHAWPQQSLLQQAREHTFVPQDFHRLYSSSAQPVLRVHPGDIVRTTTVDAAGRDQYGIKRARGGNPVIGPFYIEGALPGDTIAICLSSICPNRESAFSGRGISSNATSATLAAKIRSGDRLSGEWSLDLDGKEARLAAPTDRLKMLRVPLRPMLGCIAVAPPRKQSFDVHELGVFGGNIDYKRMTEGAIVYLPVFEPGALLYLGDGHAAQGAGELTGDALEVSMEIAFTTEVLPNRFTPAPRFEDDEFLMASGIAGSLDEALKQATSSLVLWLETDYSLSVSEIPFVLGFGIEYDIAVVVNPKLHVVARIAKSFLAGSSSAVPGIH